MYNWLKRNGYAPAFDHPGIYQITIDGIIVYIGKSRNMMWRLAKHNTRIKYPDNHKYRILAEAKRKGHCVRFEAIYDAKSTNYLDMVEEIGANEGYYIRKYLPPLNEQIPKEGDWHKFDVNPRAREITLEEILREGAANGNDS